MLAGSETFAIQWKVSCLVFSVAATEIGMKCVLFFELLNIYERDLQYRNTKINTAILI